MALLSRVFTTRTLVQIIFVLTAVVMTTSVMISYTRSRAENVIPLCSKASTTSGYRVLSLPEARAPG